MDQLAVKFNDDSQKAEFYKVVRKRVNAYFKENNISKYGNVNMYLKTIFMVTLYFTPLILMLTGVVNTLWPIMLMWALMGFGMAGIGLSIMHDANHGSYSKNPTVNKIFGYILNFNGGFPINWKIQHNVLHHSFTNIDGHDEDIEKKGLLRFSPNQERKPFFRFQIFYVPVLYGVLTLYWFLYKDFDQLIKYNKQGLLKTQNTTLGISMFELIINKLWYLGLTIILPIMLLDILWWQVLLGFLLMQFIAGLILALIFQCAHVLSETEFFETDKAGSVENEWAIHQMKTTANFANDNKLFTWLIGGLNFQVEHHLFPNVCHVHYKKISPILKATAEEFGVPYNQHRTFRQALISHFTFLNQLGTGKYDELKLQKTS